MPGYYCFVNNAEKQDYVKASRDQTKELFFPVILLLGCKLFIGKIIRDKVKRDCQPKNFIGLKDAPLPSYQRVISEKSDNSQ